jgi:hypothetical protein
MVKLLFRKESGNKYYDNLAKQIAFLCQKLMNVSGGLVAMTDLFLYYNKTRPTCKFSLFS